ncbi:MAG: peroxiredoxin [Bacteroidota bacterium]|jgi:peroxiredoxin|nr:peroxiredoxin [Bacteroidota bacterium]
MPLTIGQQAPSFLLVDTNRNKVSLEEQRGKNVILLFFPFAFSGTCTKELCTMRDDIVTYNNADAVVFGISTDSFFTLAKYKEDQKLNFELLSDFNKKVSAAYDSLYGELLGMQSVSKRSAFVIDKQGIVRYAEVLENATEIPDFNKIKATLSVLS